MVGESRNKANSAKLERELGCRYDISTTKYDEKKLYWVVGWLGRWLDGWLEKAELKPTQPSWAELVNNDNNNKIIGLWPHRNYPSSLFFEVSPFL